MILAVPCCCGAIVVNDTMHRSTLHLPTMPPGARRRVINLHRPFYGNPHPGPSQVSRWRISGCHTTVICGDFHISARELLLTTCTVFFNAATLLFCSLTRIINPPKMAEHDLTQVRGTIKGLGA